MKRTTAAVGASVFFAFAPGTVAGLVPWLLTGWDTEHGLWPPVRILGGLLIAGGATVLVHAFVRFVVDGFGTPAPVAPPSRLVVAGAYRFVRNPMYVAIMAVIVGQAILFGALVLLWYALLVFVAVAAFAKFYEERALHQRFGADYDRYRRAVPAWIPRVRPWRPDADER